MADYQISSANLNHIENNLGNISRGMNEINRNLGQMNNNIESVDKGVGTVNNNVKEVYKELDALAAEFHEFVDSQRRANAKSNSQQRLIQLNQELEKKYGHYALVRRNTIGILQADDLGIIRSETITNASEELMISTPGYWLAPCLVALAAWISDEPDLAERAVREAIKRNDEKTSLFWALLCRRSSRKVAALKWTQRYLANQDEEDLDHITVIVLDAFASGLLGADSEGLVAKQMDTWLEKLREKPGFVEQQTKQWSDAINLKRVPLEGANYPYLKKHSSTWSQLADVLEGALLHMEIYNYFHKIFQQEASTSSLKEQLDEILDTLVSEFDAEEAPIRKETKYHELVTKFDGDEKRAKNHMKIEETAFEQHKDFTQLLTDAAMNPESSHASVSTQKFAIALSRDWINNAYTDLVAQNRMKVPHEIHFKVENFDGVTTDGQNEREQQSKFEVMVAKERENALAQCFLSAYDNFCNIGGIAIAGIGFLMMILGNVMLGLIAIISGIGMHLHYRGAKAQMETNRANINTQFDNKKTNGVKLLRAILAEVVDYRVEFDQKDSESAQVLDFLSQISPDQYVRKLSESNRRINV